MKISLVTPRNIHEHEQELIKREAPNEICWYTLARRIESLGDLRYLEEALIELAPGELEASGYGATPTCKAVSDVLSALKRVQRLRPDQRVIYKHSHPFSKGSAHFSGIDTRSMKMDRENVYDPNFGSLENLWVVYDHDAAVYDGRVIGKGGAWAAIEKHLVLGSRLERISFRDGTEERLEKNARFCRAELIPGYRQEALSNMRIGVVGLSGNGASLVTTILMLGLGHLEPLIFVEPERVEKANLNRILYASPGDVGRLKVDVAAEYIKRCAPEREVVSVAGMVWDAKAQEALRGCDIIFGCMDSPLGRYVLNAFCAEFGIVLIDTGAGVLVKDNALFSMGGQVNVFVPSETPCLCCSMGLDAAAVEAELPWREADLPKDPAVREELKRQGYFNVDLGRPAPSVYFLNQLVASLAGVQATQLLQAGLSCPGVKFELLPPYRFFSVRGKSLPHCVWCGKERNVLGEQRALSLEALFGRDERALARIPKPRQEKREVRHE